MENSGQQTFLKMSHTGLMKLVFVMTRGPGCGSALSHARSCGLVPHLPPSSSPLCLRDFLLEDGDVLWF